MGVKSCIIALASLLLTLGLAGQSTAATMAVDDFSTITNGVFFEVDSQATGGTFGTVTITGNPAAAGSGVGINPPATPAVSALADPGNNQGWFNSNPVTLTFDIPLAAFGVSFNSGTGVGGQPTLEGFSGSNGTGISLGIVMVQSNTTRIIDFVGLWSDALEIQSVVLTPGGASNNMVTDGYGLSLTPFESQQPIPEPGTMLLLGTGLAGIIAWRRKQAA